MRLLNVRLTIVLLCTWVAACESRPLQITAIQLGRSLNADHSVAEFTTVFAPQDTVYLSAQMDGDPADALADLYYSCSDEGPHFPIAVAVPPASIDGAIANFEAHFDATFGCGDGEPSLTARVNDGYSVSEPASPIKLIAGAKL